MTTLTQLPTDSGKRPLDVESAVADRYAQAALAREVELCCPVDYDARFLKAIPQEVIDRDYGCGDPSKYVAPGETVLDLGSGGGKICFIASQVVGARGRVIGVDMNDEMLKLARDSQKLVAQNIGFDNVSFRRGKIQDLAIDRDLVAAFVAENPVTDHDSLQKLESRMASMRRDEPMIADESIDVVVSNCVLNLVDGDDKSMMFDELFRVLKPGGRAVISDIVSDREVPEWMRNDPTLWSGCISGAYEQTAFLNAFEEAGFEDITIAVLESTPWQVVDGIEFRSMTVIAYRPGNAEVLVDADVLGNADVLGDADVSSEDDGASERKSMATMPRRMYRGPFKFVGDDAGAVFTRGEICEGDLAVAADRPSLAGQFVILDPDSNPGNTGESAAAPRVTGLPMAGDAGCCGGSSCG